MTRADLDEFVACYRPADRHNRTATWSEAAPEGRWRAYTYDEILARDKISLDSASGSTTSGVSVSAGRTRQRKTSKSLTTTEEAT